MSRSERWPILGVLALGAVLRLYRLGAWNLTLDEGTVARLTQRSAGTIWSTIMERDPFHPPLYYILAHYWRALGSSEVVLRLLSVVFGIVAIWFIYRIGAYLFDRRIGLLASVILAVSPAHIWHSQEARMYAAVVAFSLMATDAWLRVLREGARRHWVAYVMATTLSVYTDYSAFLVLAAQNVATVVLLATRRGPRLGHWLAAQIAIAGLYLPWALVPVRLLIGLRRVLPVAPNTDPSQGVALQQPLELIAYAVAWIYSAFLPRGIPALKIVVILTFGALMVGGGRAARRTPTAGLVLGAIVAIPFLLGLVTMTRTTVLFPRMLLASAPVYYLLLAVGLSALPGRWVKAAGTTALLGVNLLSLNTMYYHTEKAAAWREAAQYVAAQIERGQALAFVDGRWRWVFSFYYTGPEVEVEALLGGPEDYDRVAAFVDRSPVVFLVLKERYRNDPEGRLMKRVSSRLTLAGRRAFDGDIVVERYIATGSPRP